MKKIFFVLLAILVLGASGFFVYKFTDLGKIITSKIGTKQVTPAPLPPIFDKLSQWVSNATWKGPQKISEITPYGKATGLEMTGEIRGKNATIDRNFEDVEAMNALGFFEDISFAADGPGSSNWGYSKTENGKTRLAIFRYSTNRLLGPENTSPPFVNLSVFVSEWFVRE